MNYFARCAEFVTYFGALNSVSSVITKVKKFLKNHKHVILQ